MQPIHLAAADVNVGLLVIFAISSMGVYGVVLAGWASNSKYALLGGLRSSAQMISYELAYGLSFAAVIMLAGSLSLRGIVDQQSGYWLGFIPRWYLFLQPVGFLIFLTAGVAETNRAPFDFPEAEQELVAGYHTEYSSMSFALFFLAEYVNMATVSAVATDLFLGGWHGPFPLPAGFEWIWFFVKVFAILFFYIWMRWTLPRYRYDQLMEFGWKCLLPRLRGQSSGDRRRGHLHGMVAVDAITFWILAAIMVVSSVLVVGQRNPMYSVFLLVVSFAALSGLYILLDASFAAMIQIIVYVGAIMVLFLFVVMLLNEPTEEPLARAPSRPSVQRGAAAVRRGAVGGPRRRAGAGVRAHLVGAAAERRPRRARRDRLRHRRAAVPRLRVRLRGDVGPDSRGHGRSHRARSQGGALTSAGADPELVPAAVGGALRHRHGGRVPAAQPHHHPALGRGDAERRQPDVHRRRTGSAEQWTGRSSCSSSSRWPPRRRPSGWRF